VSSVPFGTITTDTPAISGPCRLYGWAIKESTGAAPAQFVIRDGGDQNSTMIAPINLLANESRSDTTHNDGILCTQGVLIDVIAGSIAGAIWVERL
jgi:hypothetical protein